MFNLLFIIILCQGILTTASAKSRIRPNRLCQCEKGERGEKGDPGVCPASCNSISNFRAEDCTDSSAKLERLSESVRLLVVDAKKIAYRNTLTSCTCPAPSFKTTTTTVSTTVKPFFLDYEMLIRFKGAKGDKGDDGESCAPNCIDTTQSNIRVFSTLKEATEAISDYPDHTYVHIVNEHGRLQSVLIRMQQRLVPIKLDIERAINVRQTTLPPTLTTPKPLCTVPLPCTKLRLFALGPKARKMCNPTRPNTFCSKLSDYDNLCEKVSEQHNLKGFYRAFMSSSTQWLASFFAGVCMNAKIVNMNEQVLFDSFDEIFQRKASQNEILDVQGLKPQFQYWWHGSLPNGTASSNTCVDWSRQNSSYSGIASRLSNGMNGLFHYQYAWPCSLGDLNLGILCMETNCDKRYYYKH